MADIDERRIGDLTIRIDRLLCVGFGDCIDEAADAFELDDEGIAVFRDDADGSDAGLRDRLIAACDACPVDAITAHDADGEQLAALEPSYGLLALSLAGARRWVESDVPVRRVEIDAFVPHGSVLAPGVVDASDEIRVGDEVIVEGPEAFGIGRAEMHGTEMASSTRGVAVDVRHVEER